MSEEIEKVYREINREVIGSLNEIAGDIRELTNEIKHTVEALNENKEAVAQLRIDVNTLKTASDKMDGGLKLVQWAGGFFLGAIATISWWMFTNIITQNSIQTKQTADIEYIKEKLNEGKK